jgi:hypothetical protein
MVVENNNLLNIKNKDNNSSPSSFSFSSFSLAVLDSYSERDFSKVNLDFKGDLNLDLKQLNLLLLSNKKTFPQFPITLTLNIPINRSFFDILGTNFSTNEHSTDHCLFNYNGVLYCYVYNNIDLLILY